MLEIKELETLPVKIFGTEYALTKPTKKQVVEMQEALSTDEGKAKSLEILGSFLEKSGLPAEIIDGLQVQHLTMIIEAMTGAKKN